MAFGSLLSQRSAIGVRRFVASIEVSASVAGESALISGRASWH